MHIYSLTRQLARDGNVPKAVLAWKNGQGVANQLPVFYPGSPYN